MKRLLIMLMLAITVAPVAGCVVAPVYPARPVYAAHPACDWVPSHYNAAGVFIPGHCRR
jgi:hypothetical protein